MNRPVTIPLPQAPASGALEMPAYLRLVGEDAIAAEPADKPDAHKAIEEPGDDMEDLWDNLPV